MSLNAVVEVALHFESFRNIDLFHQGLYHLKTRIYRDDEERGRYLGIPYSHLKGPSQAAEQPKGKPPRTDHHHLIPAHIADTEFSFNTRSFLIRYCEEEVELGDVGQFRIELTPEELERRSRLMLEIDLMFADLTHQGGADHFGEQPDVDAAEFRCVSTQMMRIRGAERGLHEFCPVVFDECHFCLMNLAVHTAVVDLRFRLRPQGQNMPPLARPKTAGAAPRPGQRGLDNPNGEDNAEGGANGDRAGGANQGGIQHEPLKEQHDEFRPPPNWKPAPPAALSFAECLFGEDLDAGLGRDRTLQLAEGLYRRHLGSLAASFTQQSTWLKQICDRCLTPLQREALFGDPDEISGDGIVVSPTEAGNRGPVYTLRLPAGMSIMAPISTPSGGGGARGSGASVGVRGAGTIQPSAGSQKDSELQERLAKRLGDNVTPHAVAKLLAYDLNQVACQIQEIWHQALNVMSYAYREIASMLRTQWEERIIDQWGVSILREKMSPVLAIPENKVIGDTHTDLADTLRRTVKPRAPELASIEDVTLLPAIDQRPVLFDQRCPPVTDPAANASPHPSIWEPRIPSAPKQYRGVHLFVLVHGFQGNSFDMRLMKNNIALLYPDAIFLCSQANEDNTEGDFNEMGIRLAQEVTNYVCDWCPGSALGRLSFIAHSIGGLIVRSALPLLHEYSDKMYTFLTFSSPHVGYFLKNISLFHLGLKVLQSWRGSTCLTQLSMADSPDPRQTFLFKLSKAQGFEFFQNVVLVSCASDQYSPFDSARVEIGSMLNMHNHPDVFQEMVNHLWKPVKSERVFRFDVNFHIPENNLDTFIGRAAHIQFLECQPVMRMIIHNFSFLFR
eukprot:TRINITY_DN79002_c0_g1_i1.p1 TRINITY_DN79002_c0_g1~~TRINITY_DN79002_c0_g1_i1.p1  ORF type:complete len:843 (+),score=120.81 TRINITY_DN79002_c0_g1_i1:157-2685(+)